ncbi:MAG: carbamoyltransferase HypF [Acetobacter sp.]|nr:carbamoyltransferase HypF [Bacteroides sp.]MCM1341163.1 carbamoyltransferase HypF [Acetobacter sp.]MCM1433503.1 carbamoyltransferase HypF [Clostridiales bacterium]
MTKTLTFNGIVQGIGFRPTALRIAKELNIKGQIKNSGGSVELIISGEKQVLDSFVQRLIGMFEIKYYNEKIIKDKDFDDFTIVHSTKDNQIPFITPDLATCSDCEKELKDENNRRFKHPFISCINCGPRYTIINNLPYDRENITMSQFDMCDDCRKEYTEHTDRRCHAQTIACKSCGPEISIPIDKAACLLNSGEILAVKDIGGYHLACDVNNIPAVEKLRKIKGRDTKPFAVMFSSIKEIEEFCFVNSKEKELLLSAAKPIVLLEKKKDFHKSVCGESDYIGAFLPCNPVQIMLLDKISPLIMTSANISGEPVIIDDEEIKKFNIPVLSHNREILTPLDDSVVYVNSGRIQFIRRARGYVPLAIDIGKKSKADTLCFGGDLKAVFGIHKDRYVFLSQYFGDLEEVNVLQSYKSNISRFCRLHSFSPEKFVADAHPKYYSANLCDNDIIIQHHKAHVASVIAEHKLEGSVLGFAFDGTGYGDDGAIWGSEVFTFNGKDFKRVSHLDYVKIIGSDEISKNADLALACYLGGNELVEKALKNNINTAKYSGMGRLFDAVSALLDIKHYNSYEGECACALEACAKKAGKAYALTKSLNPIDILTEIKNAKNKTSAEELALGFHNMLTELITDLSVKYRDEQKINQIVLSGGVFNNRLLTEKAITMLEEKGFSVYINERVPSGDGAIALGQAYIAVLEE